MIKSAPLSTLEELANVGESGKRVVFVSGTFNVVHLGHMRLLKFASECGDVLVVGVNKTEVAGAILPLDVRLESVRSVAFVDYVTVIEGSVDEVIYNLKPSYVVKGKEFEDRENVEKSAVEACGGKLVFCSGETRLTSLGLSTQESDYLPSVLRKPEEYLRRHGLDHAVLRESVARFSKLKVVVIGDLIVDEYIACEALGMSQEDPTIVVSPTGSQKYVGGAGIVAAHAQSLGASVNFVSVVGNDATSQYARDSLAAMGVSVDLFEDESRPTTLKQRFRVGARTMLRVSHLRQHGVPRTLVERMLARMSKLLEDADLLIFSDFSYGCLPPELIARLTDMAQKYGVPIAADSQSSSQVGDISRFKNALLVTPTEREARLALRDFDSGLVTLAEKLHLISNVEHVVITLAGDGLVAHQRDTGLPGVWITDRLPAFNPAPLDTAGAGDSFVTCAAMSLAAGANLWQSVYLASIAAALQVGRTGNIPLRPEELLAEIND
jgi:rfaE bifunctional protein kinase chain/domain